MDINNLLVGGFSCAALVLVLVQVIKEAGLPSKYLPLTSILVAGAFLTIGALAPASVSQVVGGAVAVGGVTTLGVRFVKNQPGDVAPAPPVSPAPTIVSPEPDGAAVGTPPQEETV